MQKFKRKCSTCGVDIVYTEQDQYIVCPNCGWQKENPHYIKDEEEEIIVEDDVDEKDEDLPIEEEIRDEDDEEEEPDACTVKEKKLSFKELESDTKKWFFVGIICLPIGILSAILFLLYLFTHILDAAGGWMWLLLLPAVGFIWAGIFYLDYFKVSKRSDEIDYWKEHLLTPKQRVKYEKDIEEMHAEWDRKREERQKQQEAYENRRSCSNCIYFRAKNGIASAFNDYYCCNDANVQQTGFINKEEVYMNVSRDSVCNYFVSKNNGFRR